MRKLEVAHGQSIRQRLFVRSIEHFGRLDIVVANAGIELVDQAIVDFTEADFDRLFSVNTKGAFFTLQAAAKHVADNGRIIYVGSSTAKFPTPSFIYRIHICTPESWLLYNFRSEGDK